MSIREYKLDLEKCAVPIYLLRSTPILCVVNERSKRSEAEEITFLYYFIHDTKRLI
jgi:hypothetical protein